MANDSGARPPLAVVQPEGAPEPPQNQRVELANHKRLMEVIRARFDPRSSHLSGQQAQTMRTLNEIKDEENREPRYSSHCFYWPFLAALAVCEVPVNRFSFEVAMDARKPQIKQAVESLYNVRVAKVSTQSVSAKIESSVMYSLAKTEAWSMLLLTSLNSSTGFGPSLRGVDRSGKSYWAGVTEPPRKIQSSVICASCVALPLYGVAVCDQ